MKQLKNCVSVALFLICCVFTSAQEREPTLNEPDLNKPKLFADLPNKMELKVSDMQALFRHKVGTQVSMNVTNEFLLEGYVISKAEDPQVKSVVIRSTNRPGSVFTFTKTVTKEQGEKFVGRMVNRYSGDVLEIVKEKGRYILIKKDYYEMINE